MPPDQARRAGRVGRSRRWKERRNLQLPSSVSLRGVVCGLQCQFLRERSSVELAGQEAKGAFGAESERRTRRCPWCYREWPEQIQLRFIFRGSSQGEPAENSLCLLSPPPPKKS